MASTTYACPLLPRREIVSFLSELEFANIREEHLLNPSPDLISSIYTNILIYLDALQDDHGQADFDALVQLENPDLHVGSVRVMNLCHKIGELLEAARCSINFTLKDLLKPDTQRTGVFLSTLINFCIFRDTKLNLVEQFVNQVNVHEVKQTDLEARFAEVEEAAKREEPFVLELQTKLKELRLTIQELNNHQVALKTSFRALKEKTKEIDSKISTADYTLSQSAQENAKLRSKIVQSPEKLQGLLEEKKSIHGEIKNSERSAMESFQDKTTTLEVYSKACKKMEKHLAQMQAIQEQVNSSKTVDKEVKVLKGKLNDESVLDKSLDAKLVEQQGQVKQLEESCKAFEKERDLKHKEATKELNRVKLELEAKRRNMASRVKKVEGMHAEVDNINSETNSVIESGSSTQQELQRRCKEIVNEFDIYSKTLGTYMESIEAGL
ncbi:Kinetochore protein nuf2 [Thalictrum thalictroides]|uniref:Kinetochore protein nuf2 n=1 Tax=Thalictrum thalictroides TaxID=46969 RepID=A0A7J6XBJ3_THATH|nr:Kinetochore protein nuf2 [Thalictrum thalictroides]